MYVVLGNSRNVNNEKQITRSKTTKNYTKRVQKCLFETSKMFESDLISSYK